MSQRKTGLVGRRLVVASLLLLFVIGAAGSFTLQGAPEQSDSITVSAAISLKDALDELGPIFQVQQHRKNGGNGTAVTYNYGGSGTLARQIEQDVADHDRGSGFRERCCDLRADAARASRDQGFPPGQTLIVHLRFLQGSNLGLLTFVQALQDEFPTKS